jgi:hypothetical protein
VIPVALTTRRYGDATELQNRPRAPRASLRERRYGATRNRGVGATATLRGEADVPVNLGRLTRAVVSCPLPARGYGNPGLSGNPDEQWGGTGRGPCAGPYGWTMSALRLDMFLAHEAALVSGLRAVGRAMFHEAAEWDELGEARIEEILSAYDLTVDAVWDAVAELGRPSADEQVRAGWCLAAEAAGVDATDALRGPGLDAYELARHRSLVGAARAARRRTGARL